MFEEKVVPIKGDYLIVKNVIYTMYQKQNKSNKLFKFFWLEPIARLFHLQINLVKLFYITFWDKSKDCYLF